MREPLPPPSATGVRTAGDRYQWLVAWGVCIECLLESATGAENAVVRICVELDGAGNLDDVVVRRTRPPHAYKQVKYTVDSRTPVNTSYLTNPSAAGGPSILAKIASAWCDLSRLGEQTELAIVTNRLADPKDPLVKLRDSRTRLLLPGAAKGGPRSAAGKAREQWAAAAGLDKAELLRLLAVLDFDLGRDVEHESEKIRYAMAAAGLRSGEADLSVGVDWIAQQVVAGKRQFDLGDIRKAIDAHNLRVEETRVVVSIATLRPDPLARHAQCAVDWVDRFDGDDAAVKRRPKPPSTWTELQSDIEAISSHIGSAKRVVVTGSMRLAPAFAAGAALRMVTGIDVATVQRGVLWRSDAPYLTPKAPSAAVYDVGYGDDLAVAIEIATPVTDDVIAWIDRQRLPVSRLVVLGPSDGPRDNAVAGPEDACAIAIGIRDFVRREAKHHPTVHVFLAAPMGLALLLGNRWNRIAPTIVYEDLAGAGYDAAFTISA